MANPATPEGGFISDVNELRRRAREHLEKGAVTQSYEGDLQRSIDLLNNILASELIIARGSPVRAAAPASAANSRLRVPCKAAKNMAIGRIMAAASPPGSMYTNSLAGVSHRSIAIQRAVHPPRFE